LFLADGADQRIGRQIAKRLHRIVLDEGGDGVDVVDVDPVGEPLFRIERVGVYLAERLPQVLERRRVARFERAVVHAARGVVIALQKRGPEREERDQYGLHRPALRNHRPMRSIPVETSSTDAAYEILTKPSPLLPNATPGITSTAASVASVFANE